MPNSQMVKSCDFDHADNLVCLFESTSNAQRAPNRLNISVASFGMSFTFIV